VEKTLGGAGANAGTPRSLYAKEVLSMVSYWPYLIGFVVLIYAGWGVVLLLLQPRLLYHPVREISLTPADLSRAYDQVQFHGADGIRLTGWHVPARDSPFTILLCHGNGGNISHLFDSIDLFQGLGLSCFVFDYRGYGRSAGRPTEAGTYLDAQAAYDWLTGEKGVPPDRIVLLGRSLGGSIAAHLAARVPCRALVLEGAFTSYVDMAARLFPYLPVRLFRRFLFRYDTLASLRAVRCPVLVIHSRDDELVPFEFGLRLFEAAPEPKRFLEISGGHNEGFLLSGDTYRQAWRHWPGLAESRRPSSLVPEVAPEAG
jgi:fermentation-respiration switch protein FrsA (DUF1100 family)